MTLPASGAIDLAQIAGEFGLPASSSFPTAFYGKGGAPSSGALSFADFYGRSGALPISASPTSVILGGFNQGGSSTITATGGRTISSISLVGGTANARINPGTTGAATATGSASTPASGNGSFSATYRYTASTGEAVDVLFNGSWGTS